MPMSQDDEDHFRPRPGRIRSDGRGGAAPKSFFTRVRKIARQHGAAPPGASAYRKSGGSGGRARGKVGAGRGVRRGRGAAFVRGRTLGERGWSHRQPGARRVMVKSRSVRAAGKNGRAAAHLRYIQRDGTSRDGERGRLYSATQNRTDGDAFLDRGKDDRHQFRVIVSPEDGMGLGDLSGFTRDLMSKLEGDLGTKLDWVAVNHFNTGHPHVHVIINGRDELNEDLVINGDYIAHGIRERASELVTLDFGDGTEFEGDQLACPLANAMGDVVAIDDQILVQLIPAVDDDVNMGMAGIKMVHRHPVELRSQVSFEFAHEVAGEAGQVAEAHTVLRRDNDAELVAIVLAAIEEGIAVGPVLRRRIQPAALAIARGTVALDITQMSGGSSVLPGGTDGA